MDFCKKKMVVVLPRGETIRNFVYSGVISDLSEIYEIVGVSIHPNIKIQKILQEHFQNVDILEPVKET